MIKSLHIKDYAIIKEVNIDFKPGLTVITGETGSGKSIILNALGVSIGAKVNKQMVRGDAERTVVVSKFSDFEFRRVVSNKGRSKLYRDDEPISLSKFKFENNNLIDFHGQHDQQLILDNRSHIDYLDKYCQHQNLVARLSKIFYELIDLKVEYQRVKKISKEKNDRLNLLEFQANEIDLVNPSLEEDNVIQKKFKKLSNMQKIKDLLQNSKYILSESEPSVEEQVAQVQKDFISLVDFDSDLQKVTELLKEAMIHLGEASAEISSQITDLDFDQDEINTLEERINAYDLLKRKYGGSIESILEERESIQNEIVSLKNLEKTENSILSDIKKKEISFSKLAVEVHRKRKLKSKQLSRSIEKKMAELNMPNAKFYIDNKLIENKNDFVKFDNNFYQANSKGIDIIEFYLSANPGESLKPLSVVASGGEVSRIMLAIKTVFQNLDPVKTLVFDEIDTGISGMAAKKVSNHLLELSKSKQVICITHLPQIANSADNHLHVSKHLEENATFVNARYLNKNERPKIIHSLFNGDQDAFV